MFIIPSRFKGSVGLNFSNGSNIPDVSMFYSITIFFYKFSFKSFLPCCFAFIFERQNEPISYYKLFLNKVYTLSWVLNFVMQLKNIKTSILRSTFIVFQFIVLVKIEKSSPNQTAQDFHFKQKTSFAIFQEIFSSEC